MKTLTVLEFLSLSPQDLSRIPSLLKLRRIDSTCYLSLQNICDVKHTVSASDGMHYDAHMLHAWLKHQSLMCCPSHHVIPSLPIENVYVPDWIDFAAQIYDPVFVSFVCNIKIFLHVTFCNLCIAFHTCKSFTRYIHTLQTRTKHVIETADIGIQCKFGEPAVSISNVSSFPINIAKKSICIPSHRSAFSPVKKLKVVVP
jgi:hypothetical protein